MEIAANTVSASVTIYGSPVRSTVSSASVACISTAAGRHPGIGRHGLRGAWHRPYWGLPADRSVPYPRSKRADANQ